ncbi:nucleoside hydrolase [bacterium]|nr:MAG: nucleoside hydrolase [bacterium]
MPVLFDTDIGTDIDDAVALAYLLRQPRCELLGVTTVTGDVQKRAAIAEVLCRVAGREDIPIHCGRREPLGYGKGQPDVAQYVAIADQPHRLDRPENTAVDFLRETIRSRPGEIVLLTVGPMANIATLFAIDPEIPQLLRGLVSMAGDFFHSPRREWNIIVDPEAAAIVYSAVRKEHRSFGLDVTLHCQMPAAEVDRQFQGDLLRTVHRLALKWFEHTGEITFHDPLAAAAIFQPGICEEKAGRVRVILDPDSDVSGLTAFEDGPGADRVAKSVDVAAFFQEYFAVTRS